MTPYLTADIEFEEGRKLIGYPDSVGVPTIGVGHTGKGIKVGQVITNATADGLLHGDIQNAIHDLDSHLPWWRDLSDERQDVMVQMTFQLGMPGLMQFVRTLAAIKRGDYAAAGAYMLESKWARQDTPKRAQRMSAQVISGVRAWQRPTHSAPKAQNATPPAILGGPETAV